MAEVGPLADIAGFTKTIGTKASLHAMLDLLPLSQIEAVTFYKRDEITTDLICCDVVVGEKNLFFHEEAEGWGQLIERLEQLPGFRSDWHSAVSQPPLSLSKMVAFRRD